MAADIKEALIQYCDVKQEYDDIRTRRDTLKRDGLCNYQDSGKTVLTAEKRLIQLEGCAMIPGDIAPELPVITKGDIKVFGVTRHIYKGTKCRNPDGTVNYVRLDVM